VSVVRRVLAVVQVHPASKPVPPNNSFKPTPFRHFVDPCRWCCSFQLPVCALRVGLIQALGVNG